MNRTELFQIADKHLNQQNKAEALALTKQELLVYCRSEEGQEEIRSAPHIQIEFNDNFPLQLLPVERIVDLLMQEVIDYAKNR